MNADETYAQFARAVFHSVRDGSLSEERFVKHFVAASHLADAANALGHCGSMDRGRTAHTLHCARCLVKTRLKQFEVARFS